MTTETITEDKQKHARESAIGSYEHIVELLDKHREDDTTEDFEQQIQEMPLSIQVRGGWSDPGSADLVKPVEAEILLATGGPAVRVMVDLDDNCEPHRAYLQGQDWYIPWFDVFPGEGSGDVLLAFANCFYYGE